MTGKSDGRTCPYSAPEQADTTTGGRLTSRIASNRCSEPMMFDSKVETGSNHDSIGKLCAPR